MRKLLIFNLETDSESPVLAVGIDWILNLSRQFDSVEVWSTHVGEKSELGNMKVEEIGGGSLVKRLRAISRLARLSLRIVRNRNDFFVFHHMSPRTAIFPGIPFRMIGIAQGLWYSHASNPISLRIATLTVNHIFTSTRQSFPIHSKKVLYVGHGIPVEKFIDTEQCHNRKKAILYLGRISPVKQLESLVQEMSKIKPPLPIVFFGSENDSEYAQLLRSLAENERINLTINNSVKYIEVPKLMSSFKYFYSGTKGSVDKAALEAALAGCLILSSERITLDLTGMSAGWRHIGQIPPKHIADQIRLLEALEGPELSRLKERVIQECHRKNNLKNTTTKIAEVLKSKS